MHVGAAVLIVVNVLNIALICLLFYTARVKRTPRHPVVSTILWTAIPRSLVACMPAFVYEDLRARLPWELDPRIQLEKLHGYQQTALGRFCAAQAIMMYYFLAAQAFFAVCFTVPMLIIAVKSAKLWRHDSRDSKGKRKLPRHVKLPSATLLSVSPFVWSLPMIFLAIPVIISGERNGYPTIYFTPMGYCTLDSYLYQLVSATFVGLPLIFGLVLAVLVLVFIGRFYAAHKGVPRRGRSVDAGLLLRFTGILVIIYFDAIILLCEICLVDLKQSIWGWDMYWTALTPMVEFLLFGSQTTFLYTWRDWFLSPLRRLGARIRARLRRRARNSDVSQEDEKDDESVEAGLPRSNLPDPITPARTQRTHAICAPAVLADEEDEDGEMPRFVHQDIEDEGDLAWSSEDEFDRSQRALRQARRRARKIPMSGRLWQWERPVRWDNVRTGEVGPPSITVSRASDDEEYTDATRSQALGDVLEEENEDGEPTHPTPRHQQHRPRLHLITGPTPGASTSSMSITVKSTASSTGSISASSSAPLRPAPSPPTRTPRNSRPSSPTFTYPIAGLSRTTSNNSLTGLSRTGSRTSLSDRGLPMDYIYGEMHTFMGIVGLPRPRAVEMHAAARIMPDGISPTRAGRRPRRRGDPIPRPDDDDEDITKVDDPSASTATDTSRRKSGRRKSRSKMFSFDEAARPASLSTVDESLAALPRPDTELETWHEHEHEHERG